MIESVEIGKEYLNGDGHTVKVNYVSKENTICTMVDKDKEYCWPTERALRNWTIPVEKPKKLYAYEGKNGRIDLYDNDEVFGERLPHYDIEFKTD